MTGVQALARLPVNILRSDGAAGLKTAVFISGYEGSPLGGYDLELQRHAKLLAEYDLVFQPGVNEELAATSVAGHAAGRRAWPMPGARASTGFWYGKSPGPGSGGRCAPARQPDRHAPQGRRGGVRRRRSGGQILDGARRVRDTCSPTSGCPCCTRPIRGRARPRRRTPWRCRGCSGLWVALKIATNVADGSGDGGDRLGPGRSQRPERDVRGQAVGAPPDGPDAQPHLAEMERSREGIRKDVARAYALANRLNRIQTFGPAPRIGISRGREDVPGRAPGPAHSRPR